MASPVTLTTWSTPKGVCQWHCCLHSAPSVPFSPHSESEDGEHQPSPAKRQRVHSDADKAFFDSVCECFYVVRYYRRASLCHSPFWNGQLYLQPLPRPPSVLPLSLHLFFISTTSLVCGPKIPRSPFDTPVAPVTLNVFDYFTVTSTWIFPSLNASSSPHKPNTDPENPCCNNADKFSQWCRPPRYSIDNLWPANEIKGCTSSSARSKRTLLST